MSTHFTSFAETVTSEQSARYMLLYSFPGLADRGRPDGAPLFKLPAPPEWSVADYTNMRKQLARPETDTQAAAVTASINWYRWVALAKPAAAPVYSSSKLLRPWLSTTAECTHSMIVVRAEIMESSLSLRRQQGRRTCSGCSGCTYSWYIPSL